MSLTIEPPRVGLKWGRWKVVEVDSGKKQMRVICTCGSDRSILIRKYLTGQLSFMCRQCRQETERQRLTRMFFKEEGVGHADS